MAQVLAEGLYLSSTRKTEVTQAVGMGDDNTVKLQVSLIACSAASLGTGVTVTVEGSDDLENWDKMAMAYQAIVYNAPAVELIPYSSPMSAIPFDYVRVKFEQGGSEDVILDAALSTSKMA